jgi:hypothetical protein
MIVEIITPRLGSGHSNLYILLAQMNTESLVLYPLNRPIALPTALEWKSASIWVGRLIHLV